MDWRSLPSLSSLKAFDAAARHLNFSSAARSLNVTPAAIIQQVRALEADLGVTLARRSGRGIALTSDGERFAQVLDVAFREIFAGVSAVRKQGQLGGIRVSTTPNIVSEFLMGHLSSFWETHPDIEVAFVPSGNYVEIAFEDYDLAVRGGKGDFQGVEAQHLLETRWLAVTAPENVPDGSVDLNALKWVRNPDFFIQNELIQSAGVNLDTIRSARVLTPGLTLDAVRQGLGATIANAFIVRKDLAAGRLVGLEIETDMPRVAYWAVTPKGQLREATKTFMDWLKAIFAEEIALYPAAGSLQPGETPD